MQKSDFPLLANHPEIIYLDNAATTQKPAIVIDGVSRFIQNDYANIHRGLYSLSENSELHYHNSKKLVSELINCTPKEPCKLWILGERRCCARWNSGPSCQYLTMDVTC